MFRIKHTFVFLVVLASFCLIAFVGCDRGPRVNIRTVYIKAVVNKEFASCPEWEKLIKDIVEAGSYQFNAQLGIELKLKKIEKLKVESDFTQTNKQIKDIQEKLCWGTLGAIIGCAAIEVLDRNKLKMEMDLLAEQVDFEDCDIVVYFSAKDYGRNNGSAEYLLGRRALITYKTGKTGFKKMVKIFIHEIGHLFGAVHFYRRNSVMHPGAATSLKFDKINREFILKHKFRDFQEQPEEK